MEQTTVIKCLNVLCENEIPENRSKHIEPHISRWCFCVPCLKHDRKMGSSIIQYECRRDDCSNKINFDRCWSSPPKAYCSDLCFHRNIAGTKSSEKRVCQMCRKSFMSNLGYTQRYCGEDCRKKVSRKKSTVFISSQTLIVQLLQRSDSDLMRVSKYIKKDFSQTRNLITVLRKKGHHITLSAYQGKYHYEGFKQ